jgi:exonuclease III
LPGQDGISSVPKQTEVYHDDDPIDGVQKQNEASYEKPEESQNQRKPIPTAKSYRNPPGDQSRIDPLTIAVPSYCEIVESFKANNELIPKKDNAFRVMTFNIHFGQEVHVDLLNLENPYFMALGEVIRYTPSVAILQEVRKKHSEMVKSILEEHGYSKFHFSPAGIVGDDTLINLVCIRDEYELTDTGSEKFGCRHSAYVTVRDPSSGKDVLIVGSHLELYGGDTAKNLRRVHVDGILETIRKKYSSIPNVVITGDFNGCISEFTQLTGETTGYNEVFHHLQWPQPEITSLYGHWIDFIFASDAMASQLVGAYVVHTRSSDHFPVIADFEFQ